MNDFLKSKYGKYTLISAGLFLIIIIILITNTIFKTADNASFSEEVDSVSGATIYVFDAEPEEPEALGMIGFDIFYNLGFSAKQQATIYDAIQNYVSTNYPNTSTVSYVKDSFLYTATGETDFSKSRFNIYLDSGETFIVSLDTENQINTIKVTID